MPIAGTVYLLRGEPVTALAAWRQPRTAEQPTLPLVCTKATTPRNVQIRMADGSEQVRPFRGLRRLA